MIARLQCWLFGHHIGRNARGPWPGWARYHCPRCDRWVLVLNSLQITTDIVGLDAVAMNHPEIDP